uniref:Amino acid permease/ SLC12A domain-containing protein n=1 Tax=Heterosigma akashiwo TaxID=2829 RepID=A0A6V3APW4_HETAK
MDFQKNAVGDGWFPSSSSDILKGMPFILWLFLGIEEVPLAVEEVANPVKTIPRGIAGGLGTLGALAALTVTLTCALPPGAGAYARDPAPLLTGFRAILGPSKFVDAIGCAVVVGLVCSLHTLVYFSGQTVAALARGGVYPAALGRPGPRGTPARALGLVAFSALALLFMLFGIFGEDACTSIPVALSLMVSMFSYVMQLISYIKISHVPPNDALLCSKDGCKKLLGNYSSTARAPAFSVPTTVLGQDDNVGIGLPSSLTMRSSPSPGVQYYQSPFGISGAICGIVLGILIWSCLVVLGFSDWSYASAFIASAFLFLVTFLCFSFFNSNGCFFNAKNKVSFAQPYCQNAPCMLGNTGQTRRASGPVAAKLHEIDASALDNNSYKRSIDDGEILSSCAIEPVPSIAQPNEQDQSCASMSTTLAMV